MILIIKHTTFYFQTVYKEDIIKYIQNQGSYIFEKANLSTFVIVNMIGCAGWAVINDKKLPSFLYSLLH